MFRFAILALFVLLCAGAASLTTQPPAPSKLPQKLLEQQTSCAERTFNFKLKQLKSESARDIPTDLPEWSLLWLEAELALRDKKEDRIAALKAHVDRGREVERLAITLAKEAEQESAAHGPVAGRAREEEEILAEKLRAAAGQKQAVAEAAAYFRIDAEIRYRLASGRTAPPAREANAKVPAPATPMDLRDLYQQRADAARRVYEGTTRRIVQMATGMPSEYFGWSERWLDAELALNPKKEERIACLKRHMDRTREAERLAINYWRAARGTHSDADAATYEGLGADFRYYEATGKIPAQPPGRKIEPGEGPPGEQLGQPRTSTQPPERKPAPVAEKRAEKIQYVDVPTPKNAKELRKKRCEVAEMAYQEKFFRYKVLTSRRYGVQLAEIFGWSERLLDAQMALKDAKADPLPLLKDHLKRTREVERLAIIPAKRGKRQPWEADAATYDRIRADIRYFQVTKELPPPPPTVKVDPEPQNKRPGPMDDKP